MTLQGVGERILVEREGAQAVLMLGQQGVARDDPDWYDAVVLNSILGAGRLHQPPGHRAPRRSAA